MTVGLRKRCFLINEKPSRSIALEERKSKQNAEPIQFADKRKQTYRRQKAFIAGPKWRKKSIHFGIVYLLKKPDKSIEIPCLMATCLVWVSSALEWALPMTSIAASSATCLIHNFNATCTTRVWENGQLSAQSVRCQSWQVDLVTHRAESLLEITVFFPPLVDQQTAQTKLLICYARILERNQVTMVQRSCLSQLALFRIERRNRSTSQPTCSRSFFASIIIIFDRHA